MSEAFLKWQVFLCAVLLLGSFVVLVIVLWELRRARQERGGESDGVYTVRKVRCECCGHDQLVRTIEQKERE
jgi:hypothetical protein